MWKRRSPVHTSPVSTQRRPFGRASRVCPGTPLIVPTHRSQLWLPAFVLVCCYAIVGKFGVHAQNAGALVHNEHDFWIRQPYPYAVIPRCHRPCNASSAQEREKPVSSCMIVRNLVSHLHAPGAIGPTNSQWSAKSKGEQSSSAVLPPIWGALSSHTGTEMVLTQKKAEGTLEEGALHRKGKDHAEDATYLYKSIEGRSSTTCKVTPEVIGKKARGIVSRTQWERSRSSPNTVVRPR